MTTFTIYRDRKKQHRSHITSKGRVKWDNGEGHTRRGTVVNSIAKLVDDITKGKWRIVENGVEVALPEVKPKTKLKPESDPADKYNFTVTSRPLNA